MPKSLKLSKKGKSLEKRKVKFSLQQRGIKMKSKRASTNPDRVLPEGTQGPGSNFRTKQTIKRLNMYNEKPNWEKMNKQSLTPARVQPDRKWFGNVRTIDQKALEKFRVEIAQKSTKANEFLIRAKTLPTSLLVDPTKENKMNLLEIEKFEDTFGPKKKRKRPKISENSYESLLEKANEQTEKYNPEKDGEKVKLEEREKKEFPKDRRLEAGQSKRIWEELYKVLDSSDVICQVLDARDPMGTRSKHVEDHLKKNCPHKHLVFVLNKVDLCPPTVTNKWIEHLSKEYPTISYHANINHPFGKNPLINLLRQFDNFHKDKQHICVGFIGFPNVGKSSVINSLKEKKVCKAAPVPGETRVWQYVTLTKRIYLIDCPGVVYTMDGKDESDMVLKGAVRVERLEDPLYYVDRILKKVKKEVLQEIYDIDSFEDEEEFLKLLAKKQGKLIKGGEPDLKTVAKIVIADWQRGEIPYFVLPPNFKPGKKKKGEDKDKEVVQDKPEEPEEEPENKADS